MLLSEMFLVWVFWLLSCCELCRFLSECHCASAASALSPWWYFFSFCLFSSHRSLTSNLPNVNLPNVNLPKVPNLPVNIPLGIPQMPAFSAPSWMAAIYDAECVFSSIDLISSKKKLKNTILAWIWIVRFESTDLKREPLQNSNGNVYPILPERRAAGIEIGQMGILFHSFIYYYLTKLNTLKIFFKFHFTPKSTVFWLKLVFPWSQGCIYF